MPLQIIRQDITKMKVDAVINSTNWELIGYSGADKAIHKAAGPKLDAECARLAPMEEGEVVITGGYDLPCRYIIHTSGPVWEGGKHDEELRLKWSYITALSAAYDKGCESVAVPLISAGNSGYPKDQVLKLAIHVITDYLFDHEMTVFLCVFDRSAYEFSRRLFGDITEYIDDAYYENNRNSWTNHRDGYTAPVAGERWANRPSRPQNAINIPESDSPFFPSTDFTICSPAPHCTAAPESAGLDDWIKQQDSGFFDTLYSYMKAKNITEVECYKKANVDKKTYWKIKNSPGYKPSKPTALAFAISLELSPDETRHLLETAGLSLSRSFKFDLIVEYFISRGQYDIMEINEALFEFDQQMLGNCIL